MEGQSSVPAPVPPAGSVPTAGHSPIAAGPSQRLVYDGRLGELYRIFIVNLLLGLITLGVYRFWGKTRMRRYLWSRLSYDGDRFEYTGTGGELFRGFLIVAAVLVAIAVCLGFLDLFLTIVFDGDLMKVQLASSGISFVLYVALAYLLLVGQYMALRYRLTRSRWRGIRGALAGSPWGYGATAFAWMLAVSFSLGFATPVADVSLARMRLRNVFFGTAQATLSSDSGTGGLYGPYVASWFATVVGVAVIYAVPIIAIVVNGSLLAPYFDNTHDAAGNIERMFQNPRIWAIAAGIVLAAILAGTLIWAVVLVARCWYTGALLNRLSATAELAGLRLQPMFRTGPLWRLIAGNLVIVVFTLGLGTPIALHRTWRFLAGHLQISGALDGATIGQSQQAMPGRGEGLLDALDAGGAF